MNLNDFLITEIFTFMLIFCRVGAAFMLLPGFGEVYISPRVRLLFALMFSMVLTPVIANFPAPPDSMAVLAKMIVLEIIIGLFFGMGTRLLLSAISTAGTIIAYQSSLASAVVPDLAGTGGQTSSMGNLFTITVLVLIFVMDLHHVMLRSLHDSYQIFAPGATPIISDMTNHITDVVNKSFRVAVQLAAPHVIMGLVVYLAAGIVARLMPQFQVFFIMMPPNILFSFMLLMLAFGSIIFWYMGYFEESITKFVE